MPSLAVYDALLSTLFLAESIVKVVSSLYVWNISLTTATGTVKLAVYNSVVVAFVDFPADASRVSLTVY